MRSRPPSSQAVLRALAAEETAAAQTRRVPIPLQTHFPMKIICVADLAASHGASAPASAVWRGSAARFEPGRINIRNGLNHSKTSFGMVLTERGEFC